MEYNTGTALNILRQDDSCLLDLIFLDLNLAGINNKQCLSPLKQIYCLGPIPVNIYSTSNYPRDILNTQDLGASRHVIKSNGYFALKHTPQEVCFNYMQMPAYFIYDRCG